MTKGEAVLLRKRNMVAKIRDLFFCFLKIIRTHDFLHKGKDKNELNSFHNGDKRARCNIRKKKKRRDR